MYNNNIQNYILKTFLEALLTVKTKSKPNHYFSKLSLYTNKHIQKCYGIYIK